MAGNNIFLHFSTEKVGKILYVRFYAFLPFLRELINETRKSEIK